MTLADDIAAALPALRAQAESLMQDTVVIERATGEKALDPVTLAEVDAYETVYEGKARIQRPGALAPRENVAGGFEFGVNTILAQLPLSAVGLRKYDRVTVSVVGPLTDADLLNVVSTVRANLTKTHASKRTLACEEVS